MFSYHPLYRQANLNLLRTPHVSHKMKSHYRTETRTKKDEEKHVCGATPRSLVATRPGHARFRTLLFLSCSRADSTTTPVSLWRAVACEKCTVFRQYAFVRRAVRLCRASRVVSSEVACRGAEVAGFLAAGRGAHAPFHQHHIGKS